MLHGFVLSLLLLYTCFNLYISYMYMYVHVYVYVYVYMYMYMHMYEQTYVAQMETRCEVKNFVVLGGSNECGQIENKMWGEAFCGTGW